MHIIQATPELADAVADLIADDMADALIRHGADLSDDTDVIFCLHGAGFGNASIAALVDQARSLAAANMPAPAATFAEASQ